MSGLNPFGTSPVQLLFQGFASDIDVANVNGLVTRSIYNGVVTRGGVGEYTVKGTIAQYNDQNTILQYFIAGNTLGALINSVSVSYHFPSGAASVVMASVPPQISAPLDPPGLFAFIVFDATDGVSIGAGDP
jgi:hypothetical protein